MLTQIVSGRVFDYSHCVGQYLGGTQWGNEGFVQPIATAAGSKDVVFVLGRGFESTDQGQSLKARAYGTRVGKFVIGDTTGDEKHIQTFGSYGDREGQFIWPTGIALDSQENVYITDEWLNRVSIFDKDGRFMSLWGSAGNGNGKFNRPAGIAINSSDNLFIVDSLNHRIQNFTKDGRFLHKYGTHGVELGSFDSPWGIAIDNQSCTYIADHKNHRVQKFDEAGKLIMSYGIYGQGHGELNRPTDVAIDEDGDVYVCDWANNRIQVFDSHGKYITSIIGDAQELSKWGQATVNANPDIQKARRRVKTKEPEWRFALPTGVSFDSGRSRLIVSDTQRYRLQIYNKLKNYIEPQFNL